MARNIFDAMEHEYQKRRKQERELSMFLLKLTFLNCVKPMILLLLIGIAASFFVGSEAIFKSSTLAVGLIVVGVLATYRTWRTISPNK
ncbi:hypothetical protein AWH63_10040 [Marinobacter sp. C18]|uniref:hypothetical protein n=1 Tax=Marinobacter sp. C18 TaxID=1772288 RepID=UPI000948992C|nr:hypothetical protein [Marinobacter sp. C18]OLF81874.1 hypothetical protein AWH63_10040 [Marinobacter sp. C18]